MTTQKPYLHGDISVWPDGSWAFLGKVWAGEFDLSDDYKKGCPEEVERLCELYLAVEPRLRPE